MQLMPPPHENQQLQTCTALIELSIGGQNITVKYSAVHILLGLESIGEFSEVQQRGVLVGGALGPGKPCLEPCRGPSKHPGPQEPPSSQAGSRPVQGEPTNDLWV